jgi:hypothetical protein
MHKQGFVTDSRVGFLSRSVFGVCLARFHFLRARCLLCRFLLPRTTAGALVLGPRLKALFSVGGRFSRYRSLKLVSCLVPRSDFPACEPCSQSSPRLYFVHRRGPSPPPAATFLALFRRWVCPVKLPAGLAVTSFVAGLCLFQ